MNQIPQIQNSDTQIGLLRARSQVYREATALLVLQFGFTVLLPVITAGAALLSPSIRPYTAAVALVVSVLDVTALDRLQRAKLKLAAKIAEAFDCDVLGLPWNRFVAGNRADPETVIEAQTAWRGGDGKLINWYPAAAGKAPLHLGRIICQRTNLWYDAKLRRRYGAWVLIFAAALLLALVIAAAFTGLTVALLISTVLPPAAPVLIWSVREYFRQRDTADAQETAKAEAEGLWDLAKAGDCAEPDCAARSREFQNAIYARRVSSPLMLPGVYGLLRPAMEDQMNKSAETYLAELGLQ
jgi:membrane protein YqaA with SNARE-associated domain